jgi:excisionase family DNA binding protein
MRTELEEKDLVAIAEKVAAIIKPMLTHSAGSSEKDTVFDVKGLAGYLHVNPSWVYQQIHTHSIPYFKIGKYPRFKRKEIDRWMEGRAVRPLPVLKVIKARGVST